MIRSSDLKQLISYKLGHFRGEPLLDEELKKVRDLSVCGKRFNGRDTEINWEELSQLPNLELLSLSQCVIDDAKLRVLEGMPQIKSLSFSRCNIKGKRQMNFEGVTSIIYRQCDVNDFSKLVFAENTTFIGVRKLDLTQIAQKNRVRKLVLSNCYIDSFKALAEYNALEHLQLEGITVEDAKSRNEIREGINIRETSGSNPIR